MQEEIEGGGVIGWQPIETAPDLERVMVCGWQPSHNRTRGYWWWHEDVVHNGKAVDRPDATHWTPIILPDFPLPPIGGDV